MHSMSLVVFGFFLSCLLMRFPLYLNSIQVPRWKMKQESDGTSSSNVVGKYADGQLGSSWLYIKTIFSFTWLSNFFYMSRSLFSETVICRVFPHFTLSFIWLHFHFECRLITSRKHRSRRESRNVHRLSFDSYVSSSLGSEKIQVEKAKST